MHLVFKHFWGFSVVPIFLPKWEIQIFTPLTSTEREEIQRSRVWWIQKLQRLKHQVRNVSVEVKAIFKQTSNS